MKLKLWYRITLEVLILLGTLAWGYFFPREIFAKGMVGFALIYLVEELGGGQHDR